MPAGLSARLRYARIRTAAVQLTALIFGSSGFRFVDGGRRFSCNFCGFTCAVPDHYFANLDHTGMSSRHSCPYLYPACRAALLCCDELFGCGTEADLIAGPVINNPIAKIIISEHRQEQPALTTCCCIVHPSTVNHRCRSLTNRVGNWVARTGRRHDIMSRPELLFGTVEYKATSVYVTIRSYLRTATHGNRVA